MEDLVRLEQMRILVGSVPTTYKYSDDLGKDLRESVLVLFCTSVALVATAVVQVYTS